MRFRHVNPQTRIIPSALPFSLGEGPRAILLLHGFTGYPIDMRPLAQPLAEARFHVRVPRLPGHGSDGKDFQSSDWKDWLRRGIDEYLELASVYQPVYVAGLSMGGLLASLLAARFSVEKTLLLAPAFQVTNPLIAISGVVGLFLEKLRGGSHEAYQDPQMEQISREYWDYLWPRQTWGLKRLQSMALRGLPQIPGKILTIVSESDETVPASVAALVEKRATAARPETIRLLNSGHVLTRDSEADTVIDESVRFFT